MTLRQISTLFISFPLFFIASLNINAQSGFNLWENVSPPGQGNIVAIDCDYRNGKVYSAEETEGLFMSKDGGRRWSNIFSSETGIFNNSVGVKIPVNKKGVVFYALQNALYKSADSGTDWFELTRYDGEKIVSFDIDPAAAGIYIAGRKWIDLLVGGKRKRIFKISEKRNLSIRSISADPYLISRIYITFINGDTAFLNGKEGEWEENYMKSRLIVNILADDPWTPGRMYAVSGNEVFIRDDKDGIWQKRGEIGGLENSPCLPVSFVASKRRKGLVLVSYPGCGVYMSRNGGKNWMRVIPGDYIVLCIAEKLSGNRIICGTLGDGIIILNPASSLLKKINIIGGYIKNFTAGYNGLKKIFAVTYSGRVFKSAGNAKSWKEITPRSDESFLFAESFISGGKNFEIAVDIEGNCFTRTDENNEWKREGVIVSEDKILSLSGTGKGVYAVTESILLYSDDGRQWKTVFSSDKSDGINNLSPAPDETGKVIFISGGKIYIAGDGDVIEDIALPGEDSKSISAVFGRDETIYALSDKDENIYSRGSADKEWKEFAHYPESINPSDLFICSDWKDDFYILDTAGNLYRTSERGENWFQVYRNDYPGSFVKAYRSCSESKVFLFNGYEGLFESDTGFSFRVGTTGMAWRAKMISFPVKFIENADYVRKRLDGLISGRWRLYAVPKRSANKYKRIRYLNQLKEGMGYWLIYSGSVKGRIPGIPSGFLSYRTLSLFPGWNMLANPFPYKIRISQIGVCSDEGRCIQLFSDDNTITARGIWKWSASKKKYIIPDIINTGDSFWIKNLSSEKIKIKINPEDNGDLSKSVRENFTMETSLPSISPISLVKRFHLNNQM